MRGPNLKKDPMAEVTGDAPDKWDKVNDNNKDLFAKKF